MLPTFWITFIAVFAIVVVISTIIYFVIRTRLIREHPLEYALSILVVLVVIFISVNFFVNGKIQLNGVEIDFSSWRSDDHFLMALGMILTTVIILSFLIFLLRKDKNDN